MTLRPVWTMMAATSLRLASQDEPNHVALEEMFSASWPVLVASDGQLERWLVVEGCDGHRRLSVPVGEVLRCQAGSPRSKWRMTSSG